jgi:hypothetical protein
MANAVADRILTWYMHVLEGDNTSVGPVYVLDRDYQPRTVRVHVKRAPDARDMTFDIKDDGVSIFTVLPRLVKGQTSEDVAEDFLPSASTMAKYSLVTLDLYPAGAAGITVQLELVAEQDDEMAESDT